MRLRTVWYVRKAVFDELGAVDEAGCKHPDAPLMPSRYQLVEGAVPFLVARVCDAS